jgi:hypothetical protein
MLTTCHRNQIRMRSSLDTMPVTVGAFTSIRFVSACSTTVVQTFPWLSVKATLYLRKLVIYGAYFVENFQRVGKSILTW